MKNECEVFLAEKRSATLKRKINVIQKKIKDRISNRRKGWLIRFDSTRITQRIYIFRNRNA